MYKKIKSETFLVIAYTDEKDKKVKRKYFPNLRPDVSDESAYELGCVLANIIGIKKYSVSKETKYSPVNKD